MFRPFPTLGVCLLAAACSAASAAEWSITPAGPADDGPIRVREVRLDTADGTVRGLVAAIDLTDPRVEVVVTDAPASPPPPPADTHLQGVAAFAREHGLALAVNANYFGDCGRGANVLGLCVSDGATVSPARFYEQAGDPVLTFGADGRAAAFVPDAEDDPRLAAFDAVAGIGASPTDPDHGGLLVLDGVSLGDHARVEPLARHPRTAAGVDTTGRVLTLVVLDGREAGGSIGATLPETAALLLQSGVDDAVNLDGGGSSVMYVGPGVAGDGAAAFTSSPSEDRPVAASLGIRLNDPESTRNPAPGAGG